MDLIKLPTDNLYKFVAIFGLALIGLGVWGQVTFRMPLVRSHHAVMRSVYDEIALYVEAREESDRLSKRGLTDESEGVLREHLAKALDREARTNELRKQRKKEQDDYNSVNVPLTWSIFIGAALSLLGFWLWYDRLQRYHDAYLKRQSREPLPSKGSLEHLDS